MNLASAYALQDELISFLRPQISKRGGASSTVAIGLAPTLRVEEYAIAVRAQSEEDLPPDDLKTIREKAKGEVDLRYTGEIAVRRPTPIAGSRRVAIGASIGHYLCTAGTLGFFARRAADGVDGVVSNNHVIAAGDEGREGHAVLSPGPSDGGKPDEDMIARLAGGYPRLRDRDRIDCAFARLIDGVQSDPGELPSTPGWRLSEGTASKEEHDVAKVGRTTGFTQGRISAFNLNIIRVRYGDEKLAFTKQIEIDGIDSDPFSQAGDSGSLLFSRLSFRPVGLIYACSPAGGKFGKGLTYAHPIDSVLAALGVTLLT